MVITHLRLKNFRLYEEFEADFNEHITVLVGVNGAGKTTILDALAIAAGTFLAGLDGVSSRNIVQSDTMNVSYDMGASVDLQPRYPVEVEATGIIYDQELTWMRSLNGTNGRTTKVHAADIYTVAQDCLNRVRQGDKTLILPLISYYGTGRLWAQKKNKRDATLSRRSNRLLGYEDCLSAESNEKLMLRWFEKTTIKEFQNDGAGIDLLSVRRAVEECCQCLMGTEKIRIQYNLDTKEIDVIDRSQEGKAKRFPMHELSDGLRNTISMIADIAYRMAVLNPQLENPVKETSGIVLIDEVDLHLHPQWQQRITGILTEIFPKIQFIVTTHAPAVIASVRKENVLMLNNSKYGIHPETEVYGSGSGTVLTGVMGTQDRPESVRKLFDACYKAIDAGNLEKAENIVRKLEALIGELDPELTGIKTTIALEMM